MNGVRMKTYRNIDNINNIEELRLQNEECLCILLEMMIKEPPWNDDKFNFNKTIIMIENDLDVIRCKRETGINVLRTEHCISATDIDEHWLLVFHGQPTVFDFHMIIIPYKFGKFSEEEKIKILEMCTDTEEEVAV